jgi:Sensors of blue-light using FAD
MLLIRLTYFSRNRLTPSHDTGGIDEILATSNVNNLRNNITGVLIHDQRWFAQVLEGTERVISLTFERILRDRRHSDVTLVAMTPVMQRRYPAFAMRGIAHSEDNDDLFRHYAEDERFDPRQMRAERLADLIEAVVDRIPHEEPSCLIRRVTTAA